MSDSVIKEVMNASRRWVAQFNQGDIDSCLSTYQENANMQVAPIGGFIGRQAISLFWNDFLNSKPNNLVYSDIKVNVIDEKRAVLSASWSMNIARGFISKELWVKQSSGEWLLAEDDFTVLTLTANT